MFCWSWLWSICKNASSSTKLKLFQKKKMLEISTIVCLRKKFSKQCWVVSFLLKKNLIMQGFVNRAIVSHTQMKLVHSLQGQQCLGRGLILQLWKFEPFDITNLNFWKPSKWQILRFLITEFTNCKCQNLWNLKSYTSKILSFETPDITYLDFTTTDISNIKFKTTEFTNLSF